MRQFFKFLRKAPSIRTLSTSRVSKMPTFDSSFIMNHTCLRVKDPKVTIGFYQEHFGMELIKQAPVPSENLTLYMLGIVTPETKNKNWAEREGVLELRHDHGSENDASFSVNNGNGEEFRGFGHICFSVDNIEESEKQLMSKGVKFQKKLADGRQKNIAFALDPDGYWIELIEHGQNKQVNVSEKSSYKFNHSMIRVKDAEKSLAFYKNVLGFKLLSTREFPEAKFTLYFLAYDHSDSFQENSLSRDEQAGREAIIELTHNWGTESDDSFEGYHDGNSAANGANPGYGHTCVSCKDPATLCKQIEEEFGDKVSWAAKWNQAFVGDIAFIQDPDGYAIEIFSNDFLKNSG